ncbi:hypothetical protein RIR_jg37148.t1 [Rhizophagus irregularis DAOM 181602=DAOM 197198]|nr:hypothetical protein RIR_jg37148.t1 [Rhizophagus irregularis DAOM 181602=DAOM 197198]
MNQTEVTIKLSIPSIATAEATEKPGTCFKTISAFYKTCVKKCFKTLRYYKLNALNLKFRLKNQFIYNKTKTVLEHVVLNYVPYLSVFYHLCIIKITKIKSHL